MEPTAYNKLAQTATNELEACLCAGVGWSAVDPWVFASLSYDGRVVINRVPSQIKYKILI